MVQWLRPGPESRAGDPDYETFADVYTPAGARVATAIESPCAFSLADGPELVCLDERPMIDGETEHPVVRRFLLEASDRVGPPRSAPVPEGRGTAGSVAE